MTLDEAIKHCEEVADNKEQQIKEEVWEKGSLTEKNCYKCAEEHRQLAEWLKELKDYRERMPSYEAGYNDAKREIALSGEYERAYERGKSDAKQTKWIPVSEPPKELDTYLIQTDGEPYMCQCRWTDVNPFWTDYKTKPHWNIFDLPQYSKVVAWMPLPKPYKDGGE